MTDGYIVPVADSMDCTLKVNTYTDSSSSTTLWYSSTITVNIDGGVNSKYRAYDGFWLTSRGMTFPGSDVYHDWPVNSIA